MRIEFSKMQGTGNDFVVFDDLQNEIELDAETVSQICDRHLGVGADGVIRITRDAQGVLFMDYRNADGSIAEMCGNGVRAVGKWLGDRGLAADSGDSVDLQTRAGLKQLQLLRGFDGAVANVRVDMGPPQSEISTISLDTSLGNVEVHCVSMGNPHAVVFLQSLEQLVDLDIATVGSEIEHNVSFEDGTNVEFVFVRGDECHLRTWERGVGATLGCGTGACATGVVSISQQRVEGHGVVVIQPGGPVDIEWQGSGRSIFMSGPAAEVFRGVVEL